jgi:hypothetical protein
VRGADAQRKTSKRWGASSKTSRSTPIRFFLTHAGIPARGGIRRAIDIDEA